MNDLLLDDICKFVFDDPQLLNAAVNDVKHILGDNQFVELPDLVKVAGRDNATYLAFAQKYKSLFDALG